MTRLCFRHRVVDKVEFVISVAGLASIVIDSEISWWIRTLVSTQASTFHCYSEL